MRNCGLWITPWVDPGTEVIMDTSALTDEEWRVVVHNDPDPPPKDTVLVLIHPARYMDIQLTVMTPLDFADVNGRRVAASIIDKHCFEDRTGKLAQRLRW